MISNCVNKQRISMSQGLASKLVSTALTRDIIASKLLLGNYVNLIYSLYLLYRENTYLIYKNILRAYLPNNDLTYLRDTLWATRSPDKLLACKHLRGLISHNLTSIRPFNKQIHQILNKPSAKSEGEGRSSRGNVFRTPLTPVNYKRR